MFRGALCDFAKAGPLCRVCAANYTKSSDNLLLLRWSEATEPESAPHCDREAKGGFRKAPAKLNDSAIERDFDERAPQTIATEDTIQRRRNAFREFFEKTFAANRRNCVALSKRDPRRETIATNVLSKVFWFNQFTQSNTVKMNWTHSSVSAKLMFLLFSSNVCAKSRPSGSMRPVVGWPTSWPVRGLHQNPTSQRAFKELSKNFQRI